MKNRFFALFLLAALCVSLPALAIVGKVPKKTGDDADKPAGNPVFACAPLSFTLVKSADGLHFSGQVQVPTAGWTFEFNEEEPGPDGSLHATLRMIEPPSLAAEVISQVAVDHTFAAEADRLTVNTDGLKDNLAIECKMTGMSQ